MLGQQIINGTTLFDWNIKVANRLERRKYWDGSVVRLCFKNIQNLCTKLNLEKWLKLYYKINRRRTPNDFDTTDLRHVYEEANHVDYVVTLDNEFSDFLSFHEFLR